MTQLSVTADSFALKNPFRISRGVKTRADVITVTITHANHVGRGEGVPYARYGETIKESITAIEAVRSQVESRLDRVALLSMLPAGAARSAVDAALWDLEAKNSGKRVWELMGQSSLPPVTTAYTISLDEPEVMYEAARVNSMRPLLKLKLAGPDDLARVEAVRAGAPNAGLIVDANEGWTAATYEALVPELVRLGVLMIEQPLPAGEDAALGDLPRPIPICADEAWQDPRAIGHLRANYDMINIKLDKTGGLTEALRLREAAEAMGLQVMVGCMMATSLAMAPALMLAPGAQIVDLDGPLWLAQDRAHPLVVDGSNIAPPDAALWG